VLFRVWTGPDRFTDVSYFRSEAEARDGEKKEPPLELVAQLGEFEELMAGVEFIDLKEPGCTDAPAPCEC
jgi:hypothetical protein